MAHHEAAMTPAKRRAKRRAEAYVRDNYALIMLHALYQRWGLPTALLKPLARPR